MIQAFVVYTVLGGLLFVLIKRKFSKSEKQEDVDTRVEFYKKNKRFPVKNTHFKPLTPPDWMNVDEEDDILNDVILKSKFC